MVSAGYRIRNVRWSFSISTELANDWNNPRPCDGMYDDGLAYPTSYPRGSLVMASPVIPEGRIAWIVNQFHISTPFATIQDNLAQRMTDSYWTDERKQAVYDYALQVHNRRLSD